jgi:DNA helicase II / ATP-dependent DNA helicase PcrA
MISLDDFYRAYCRFRPSPDPDQRDAIDRPPNQPLFIVAGPGTGKTTCLTLRILKLILVDSVPPRGIVATTFTKKAAAEVRSRILGWGFRLLEVIKEDNKIPEEIKAKVNLIDINQIVTGTIDSICEQLLQDYRDPGTVSPVVADESVSKTLLLRDGLLATQLYKDQELDDFLLRLRGGSRFGWNTGAKNDLILSIWDRRYQDQVEWPEFLAKAPQSERKARLALGQTVEAFQASLSDRNMVDFALLEQVVLERLRQGMLGEFLRDLKVVLVDEYQDTNLLQEGIYFEFARACGGALTVVGDDDQSLYRFRGATVDLFRDFAERYETEFKTRPKPIFLKTNYRSSRAIVKLVRNYAVLDAEYQSVRVREKPDLDYGPEAAEGSPVLGMFRTDLSTLAKDLASFVHKIFRGAGYRLPSGQLLQKNSKGGDLGDCALLCSSPAEYKANDEPRLPGLLRQELRDKEPPVEIFNPRGQDLTEINVVAVFGGLLLECLDPSGEVEQRTSGLSRDIQSTYGIWRTTANAFVSTKPIRKGLKEYKIGWADRDPGRAGFRWPGSVPVLELIYGLLHFFPELHDDPEGQIYLEVFTRQASVCSQVGSFGGRVVSDRSQVELSQRSVMELLRLLLAPIAGGTIKVNEELMDLFPRDRLSVLSIHQAKGLEFPLTMVDVGSDFKRSHPAQAFKRFPTGGGTPHALEDLLRPYTDLGKPNRSGRDRSFDDLYRQYFVAYSRPQEILLLVGLKSTLPSGMVENVAMGWRRSGRCGWATAQPFIEI